MSSLTKAQYIAELKAGSVAFGSISDAVLSTLIDISLRAYSGRLPEVWVSADNAVVSGQTLYDYPTDALNITKLKDSSTGAEINFTTENQGNGDKIKPGSIITRSYETLLDQAYYADPLTQGQGSGSVAGYSEFDIEYVILHSMSSIKDTGLEALSHYVEYLVFRRKEEEREEGADQTPVSLTDRSSDGASTTVQFGDSAKRYSDRAKAALERFDKLVTVPYGTRG